MRRWLWPTVRTFVGVGLVAVLLLRTDPGKSLLLLRRIQPTFLALAAAGFLVLFVLGNLRWLLLLRALGIRFGWWFLQRVFLAGVALNSVLPTSIGGDVLRIAYTARPAGAPAAASAALADRVVGLAGLFSLSLAVSVVLLAIDGNIRFLVYAGALTAGLALAVAAVVNDRVYGWLAGRLRSVRVARAGERIVETLDHIRRYRSRPLTMAAALGLSVLVWLVHCSIWYALGAALGCTTPFIRYLLYVPLLALMTMVPVSIGGAGVRENGFVALMGRAGMAQEQSTAVALAFLFLTYAWAIVGAAMLPLLRGRAGDGRTQVKT
jgi:uncharacterized protein (TIRG00374 family)